MNNENAIPAPIALHKLTSLLVVDAIEPCLSFWTNGLGFAVQARVEEGDRLGFVILAAGELEVMYQTRASIRKDLGIDVLAGCSFLYLQVASLDAVIARLGGSDVVVERRKTFYGADEIFVREPGGNVIGFAEHAGA